MVGKSNKSSLLTSIIFKPSELKVWISTKKYQLGEFICYDLNKIFGSDYNIESDPELLMKELTIGADDFLYTGEVEKLVKYREIENRIEKFTKKKKKGVFENQDIG